MKKIVGLALSVLLLSAILPVAFAQQPTQPKPPAQGQKHGAAQDVPAELNDAIAKLQAARQELDQAGGEWGGYRMKALQNITQALENLNHAREWAKQHGDIK